jgi:hypothetical protein
VRSVRIAVVIVVLAVGAVTGLTARSASSPPGRSVGCADSIDRTSFPYLSDIRPRYRDRLVLGVVSVPPAFFSQIIPTHKQPWAYWRKSGLVVRAGSSVSVGVPKAWRKRLAITWGNTGIVSALRIVSCPGPANVGYAYAGGFYLHSRSDCVPLIFRVGRRSVTVQFGLGRVCT